jgi:hypothetical protein
MLPNILEPGILYQIKNAHDFAVGKLLNDGNIESEIVSCFTNNNYMEINRIVLRRYWEYIQDYIAGIDTVVSKNIV